jgi:hypothetical protein
MPHRGRTGKGSRFSSLQRAVADIPGLARRQSDPRLHLWARLGQVLAQALRENVAPEGHDGETRVVRASSNIEHRLAGGVQATVVLPSNPSATVPPG